MAQLSDPVELRNGITYTLYRSDNPKVIFAYRSGPRDYGATKVEGTYQNVPVVTYYWHV